MFQYGLENNPEIFFLSFQLLTWDKEIFLKKTTKNIAQHDAETVTSNLIRVNIKQYHS